MKRHILHIKLSGSTMIEVLTSMVIIMMVFGVALMIFLNTGERNNNNLKLRAFLLLEETRMKTIQEKTFIDEETDVNNMHISKKVIPYNNTEALFMLQFRVLTKSGKLLIEQKEIITDDTKTESIYNN